MSSLRQLFLDHVAKTSELPLMLEVASAKGMYITDTSGKRYLDLNSGISVSSLGHCHENVVKAIQSQAEKYMHTMVYGEHIQEPQSRYADLLCSQLDQQLDTVYFLNGGSEAVEAALKLAKKHTGRYEIISASKAYHGSTIGAESLRSDIDFTSNFLPAIPGIRHIEFNNEFDLKKISCRTACVIMEPVQAEAGVVPPKEDYLSKVRDKCRETGTLLILDEIQTGFGRTGHLMAHQKYGIVPDILLIGKAMGGGVPISAFVTSSDIMNSFTKNPALGHITTFGGNPLTTAAAYATLKTILDEKIYDNVKEKEAYIHRRLKHPIIKEIRSSGLMMSVELKKRKYLKHVVSKTIENGALIDYFLFNDRSFRLAPPLIIDQNEMDMGIDILLQAMDYAMKKYEK